MRLRAVRDSNQFYVDWWLMNHCNLRCYYCADVIRNGSAPLPEIKDCLEFVEQISEHCRTHGFKEARFSITGGEVTEWPFLTELLTKIQSFGWVTTIRSNAQSELSIYRGLWPSLSSVNLEFHPEYATTAHFAQVVASALDNKVSVTVTVMMTPERWHELESWIERLKEIWPELAINRRLLFEDPVINTQPLAYSEPQIASLINQSGDLEYWQDDVKINTDFAALIVHGLNHFNGSLCAAGLEQIIVDAWGRVYRGHCRQGGILGKIGGKINFPTTSRLCDRPICNNGFDINATKY